MENRTHVIFYQVNDILKDKKGKRNVVSLIALSTHHYNVPE